MTEKYTGIVATLTIVVCFIALASHLNSLNGAALLSIQRYAHMTWEFLGTVITCTIAVCCIAMAIR